MNDLVVMKDRQVVTSSLWIVEAFNKDHKHVIETIENKIKSAEFSADYQKMFAEGTYKDGRNREQKMYYMNRDGFSFIAMGFTGKKADAFKLKYIEAFNNMEIEIKNQQVKLPTSPREVAKLVLAANEETNGRLDEVEGDVKDLKENQVISQPDYNVLSQRVNQRVSEVGHTFGHITQEQRGKLFKDINGGVKQIANVSSRSMLRKKNYQMVMDFINDWEPSTATKTIIRQTSLNL